MTDLVQAGTASAIALTEVCRNQSLQLDAAREEIGAARERIAELETVLTERNAKIAWHETKLAELRAILAQHRLDTADEATEPEGDRGMGE